MSAEIGIWLLVVGLVAVVVALVVGLVAVRYLRRARGDQESVQQAAQAELDAARQEAAGIRAQAETEAAEIRHRAETVAAQAATFREDLDAEAEGLRAGVRAQQADLERRERHLADRENRLDEERQRLAERASTLCATEASIDKRQAEVAQLESERRAVLERAAGLCSAEAKAELVAMIEHEAKRQAAGTVREIERAAREEGEERARSIITSAIQRLASEQTSESVVATLHLPGDEMKGRIIGREGRNIRTFEQLTGVNVIIDDTPGAVLLSCFDPVRRDIARLTLEQLVQDGRIHPHRIEEVYERCQGQVTNMCVRAGEDALVEVGVADVHPELVRVLGTLRYRVSYGQNVLKHLIECARIAGLMAAELGLDVALAKRCALLHDIGKALSHEAEGSHAIAGAEFARRYGECADVVHAIEAHHDEVEPRTVEAVLTQAADAVSGGRPGARRESLEAYVQRLQRLEEIACGQEGVERVFAMQAGRELRVMVVPDLVDDIQAQVLARDIAKQVEEELTYPGQIKVTVVRESRAVEIAR